MPQRRRHDDTRLRCPRCLRPGRMDAGVACGQRGGWVDTGLLYLAAAVGTPAVVLYTGSSPHSVDFESAGPWRSLGAPASSLLWPRC
jgi:hypothetical protein